MNKIILSCLKATELVEKKQLVPLSYVEKIQLNFHMKICKKCLDYEKQSILIDKAIGKIYNNPKEHIKMEENKKSSMYQNLFRKL